MKTTEEMPKEWGVTRVAELLVDAESAEIELPDWMEYMLPGEGGRYHHGTSGSTPPDTLVLAVDDAVVALADVVPLHLANLYAMDSEYMLAVRLREVVDPAAWAGLPWAPFGPPTVVYAVDKFHGSTWAREPEVECHLTYGGGWDDFQGEADRKSPPSVEGTAWRDRTLAPSEGALLSAVRNGDAAGLRAMLAAGGDLLAGVVAPDVHGGLSLGVSIAWHHSLLVTAAMSGTLEVLEVLLEAAAPRPALRGELTRALETAECNHRDEHVALLRRYGAVPRGG